MKKRRKERREVSKKRGEKDGKNGSLGEKEDNWLIGWLELGVCFGGKV